MLYPETCIARNGRILLQCLLVRVQDDVVPTISDGMRANLESMCKRLGRNHPDRLKRIDRQSAISRIVAVRLDERGSAGTESSVDVHLNGTHSETMLISIDQRAGQQKSLPQISIAPDCGIHPDWQRIALHHLLVDRKIIFVYSHVMDTRKAIPKTFMEGERIRLAYLFFRIRWDGLHDKVDGFVDKNAGRFAGAISDNAPPLDLCRERV
jgi:hypothetical protein